MEHDVAEEQDDALSRDRCGVLIDDLRHFLERTKDGQTQSLHLPLAGLDAIGVEIATLHMGEPELSWRSGIAVRGAQHHLHIEVLDA